MSWRAGNIYYAGGAALLAVLLEITGVKTFEFGGARAVRPQAGFIDYR